jgi:Fe-Mn family superoxide dismutase
MLRPRLPRLALALRRSIHRVPPMEHLRNGIPGLLTPEGFRLAYTDYQTLMLEKLNALTAGMS